VKIEFILDTNNVILTENFRYIGLFKKGQRVVIKSKEFEVICCNRMTKDNFEVFIKESENKLSGIEMGEVIYDESGEL